MDLTCTERFAVSNFAPKDTTIFSDNRVMDNLLREEKLYMPSCNYFEQVQHDIQPFMRKVVTTWMLEVCEEQMCEDQVLPLAVNFLDRFLCRCPIPRKHFQLLGATCLLIASKIRCCTNLGTDLLSAYTDNSVSPEQIRNWEWLVLSKLEWRCTAVTGFDYIDQVIERCSWGQDSTLLRRHAHTLVSICYTEPELITTPPSLIASACICSAIRGLKLPSSNIATYDVCSLTQVDPLRLEAMIRFVENCVEKCTAVNQTTPDHTSTGNNSNVQNSNSTPSRKCNSPAGSDDGYGYSQPETPTDVQDVDF